MFRPPTSHFIADEVSKPNHGGWGKPLVPVVDNYKPAGWDDAEKKKLFGHQLGKGLEPFRAALVVFQDDTSAALWAAKAWLYDPIVMAEQEIVEKTVNLLDKDQLSAKLLKFADEKINDRYIHESKDRLAAFKLYAEIQGMMPKNGIDLSKNTFVNNAMEITLVEAEQEQVETKVIEHKEQPELENALQVDLKLVG